MITPLFNLTNDELVLQVMNDDTATPRENELVERIVRLQEEVEDLKNELVRE